MKNLYAYTVRKSTSDKSFWTRIGTAIPTRNGGFTVLLEAMPPSTSGTFKIVLQPPKADEDEGVGE